MRLLGGADSNKGPAHFTSAFVPTPEEARLIEIATLGVPALVVSYLYTPLGLRPPQSQIKRVVVKPANLSLHLTFASRLHRLAPAGELKR